MGKESIICVWYDLQKVSVLRKVEVAHSTTEQQGQQQEFFNDDKMLNLPEGREGTIRGEKQQK